METSFDVIYLVTVITLGILMIRKSHGNPQYLLFGIMAVTLGAGDASIWFPGHTRCVPQALRITRPPLELANSSLLLP